MLSITTTPTGGPFVAVSFSPSCSSRAVGSDGPTASLPAPNPTHCRVTCEAGERTSSLFATVPLDRFGG
jgi:hypothetical protein